VRGEDMVIRPVANTRTGHSTLGLTDDSRRRRSHVGLERRVSLLPSLVGELAWLATSELQAVCFTATVNFDIQTRRQCVDHRCTNTVQTTRSTVGAASELAAGVQLGEDHFQSAQPSLGFDVNWDATSVVLDLD